MPKRPTPKWMGSPPPEPHAKVGVRNPSLKESIGRIHGPLYLKGGAPPTHKGHFAVSKGRKGKKPKEFTDLFGRVKSLGPDPKIRPGREEHGPGFDKWAKERDALKARIARQLNIPHGEQFYMYFQESSKTGKIYAKITPGYGKPEPFLMVEIANPELVKAIKSLYPSYRIYPKEGGFS